MKMRGEFSDTLALDVNKCTGKTADRKSVALRKAAVRSEAVLVRLKCGKVADPQALRAAKTIGAQRECVEWLIAVISQREAISPERAVCARALCHNGQ